MRFGGKGFLWQESRGFSMVFPFLVRQFDEPVKLWVGDTNLRCATKLRFLLCPFRISHPLVSNGQTPGHNAFVCNVSAGVRLQCCSREQVMEGERGTGMEAGEKGRGTFPRRGGSVAVLAGSSRTENQPYLSFWCKYPLNNLQKFCNNLYTNTTP